MTSVPRCQTMNVAAKALISNSLSNCAPEVPSCGGESEEGSPGTAHINPPNSVSGLWTPSIQFRSSAVPTYPNLIFYPVLWHIRGGIGLHFSSLKAKLACIFIKLLHWYLQEAIQGVGLTLKLTFILWIWLLESLIGGNHAASWLVNLSLHLSFLPC